MASLNKIAIGSVATIVAAPNFCQNLDSISVDSTIQFKKEFAKNVVSNFDFYRSEFYTWTSQSQIDKIENEGIVLHKSRGVKEVSYFEKTIKSKYFKKDTLAKILCGPQFQKKRFAWVNSWSTIDAEKNYGGRLLKVKLKPEALIGIIGQYQTFVIDQKGNVIENKELESQKSRIAAVYYIHDIRGNSRKYYNRNHTMWFPSKKAIKFYKESYFQEFVIVNESMIEETDSSKEMAKERLNYEIKQINQLINLMKKGEDIPAKSTNLYQLQIDGNVVNERIIINPDYTRYNWANIYASSLVFFNSNYNLEEIRLQKIVEKLNAKLSLI